MEMDNISPHDMFDCSHVHDNIPLVSGEQG